MAEETSPAEPIEIGVYCPHCADLTVHPLATVASACEAGWTCHRCAKAAPYVAPVLDGETVQRCVCGKAEFYLQKDFNKTFGLLLAVFAFAASFVLWALRFGWAAFAVLFGLLGLDVAFYRMTGTIVVCYACSAYYRGATAHAESFDHDVGHAVEPVKHLIEEPKADAP